jgi:hypothetical protein
MLALSIFIAGLSAVSPSHSKLLDVLAASEPQKTPLICKVYTVRLNGQDYRLQGVYKKLIVNGVEAVVVVDEKGTPVPCEES